MGDVKKKMQKQQRNETAAIIFAVLKWIFIGAAFFIVIKNLNTGKLSNAAFDSVSQAVIVNADMDMMQEGDNQMIKRLYGLQPDQYEGVLLYYPTTNMGSEELFLVKLTSIEQQETVKAAIESRLEIQKNNFDGYGTYQYGMLEKSIIEVRGNYILFISGNNPSKVVSDFNNSL